MQVTTASFEEVLQRIRPYVHETPVHTSNTLNAMTGKQVFLKCELFQRMGAFKMRGATNFITQMSPEERARGVVAHSSGNHAQAVALAAKLHCVAATIVMPEDAPAVKRAATEGYGATVVPCGSAVADRERVAEEIRKATGAIFIHPYDDDRIILGQGTAGYEFVQQVPNLDTILVPVSGGGLLCGVALAAHALNPNICIIAVEPELANDAALSFAAGQLVSKPAGPTIADGLRANISQRTFAIMQQHVERVITVSEEAIRNATQLLWERTKLLAEPSAAAALAPLLDTTVHIPGQRIGVLLSGGNTTIALQ
jgi:threonine dehydratase